MAQLDTIIEIAVYVGGGLGILALLAHMLKPVDGAVPNPFAASAGCGCNKGF